MSPLSRAVTSLLILLHLTAVVGSLAIGTPPGDWIRTHSRGYERLVGVYQGWSMFAPNPPIADRWMEVTGQTADGAWIPLTPLMGSREDVFVEWRYQRAGKLERNLLSKSRSRALKDYARWLCAQEDVDVIRIEKVDTRTPAPARRRAGEPPTEKRTVVRTERCR
ncbi:MAG: hypothetical protein ACI8RZ_006457 [Myxococcota bacterium]|jgi:hypothetical protein